MKVGTDGVLLGAWFPIKRGDKVLDVGCGTGLVAIMAAQRGAAGVTAVEIDPEASGQALLNAANCPWKELISVQCADFAHFTAKSSFDRIVCNPPYFRDSLRCPDAGRNTARHNDSLSYETLVRCSAPLLAPDGLLCVVLPYDAAGEFTRCALSVGLNLCFETDVVTAPGKRPKRSLLAYGLCCSGLRKDILTICGQDGKETPEYINIVRDFYLKY